jgi:hypothetical protein
MGYSEEARQFAFSSKKDISRINDKINILIDDDIRREEDNSRRIDQALRFANEFSDNFIDESQLLWLNHDQNACLYFWLWLYKKHTTNDDAFDIDSVLNKNRRIQRSNSNKHRQDKYIRSLLPISTPDTIEQCYKGILYLLDIVFDYLDEKNDIVDTIRDEYFGIKEYIRKDFSWFFDADSEQIQWVWEQLEKHRRILREFNHSEFGSEIQTRAIPILFYLWDADLNEKTLYLNTLRKRYANMKHRKKVADKAPINIRIS